MIKRNELLVVRGFYGSLFFFVDYEGGKARAATIFGELTANLDADRAVAVITLAHWNRWEPPPSWTVPCSSWADGADGVCRKAAELYWSTW